MKQILTLLLTLIIVEFVQAQDPHFSQFFTSPLTLNPAFTGKFDGNFRVAGNYRNQWPSINNAFTTATISADFHVLKSKVPANDMFGVGIMAYNDNSANSAVKFNYFSLSTAYHKGLDEEGRHQLGIGLQATYSNMLINTSTLKFEDQLTTIGFTGNTSELFNSGTLSSSYVDINAGILYNGSSSDRNNFYLGVSLYHINKPQSQFTSVKYALNPRATIHSGAYFGLNDMLTLHLSGLQSFQGGASETVLGGAFQITANPDAETPVSLYAGSWVRLGDAIIPYIGLEYGSFRLGGTYDINTSTLKTASQGNGGMEFSLIYTYKPSTDKPINCPKF